MIAAAIAFLAAVTVGIAISDTVGKSYGSAIAFALLAVFMAIGYAYRRRSV